VALHRPMTLARYSRRMRVRGIGVTARRAVLTLGVVALVSCSSGDDSTDGTLGVIPAGSSPTGSAAPGQSDVTAPVGSGVDPAAAGSGFVSIDVRIASAGIAETLSLDRSTVAAASLDPVSLDAACTPLDGGDATSGVAVSVVDLRRLAGSRLVSAVLRYVDAAPGEHEMTLEVGSAEQVTTIYRGTVTVGDDAMSGTFSGADTGGTAVTGSFVCSAAAIATTTTSLALDAGEEVPDGAPPAPVSTVPAG
jgi:hypothetical protein